MDDLAIQHAQQSVATFGFDAERVMGQLQSFDKPREWGTPSWRVAVDFFLANIPTSNVLVIETHHLVGSGIADGSLDDDMSNCYSDMEAIVVTVHNPALANACQNALMLSAHFDSHYNSTGSSDDLVQSLTILETLRTVAANPSLVGKDGLVFTMLSAEETGLEGSHLVRTSPLVANVSVVFNLEAMGAGGRPHLTAQSKASVGHLRPFRGVTPLAPINGHGLAHDIFTSGVISSDTDTSQYRKAGLATLDAVMLKNGYIYHTRDDSAAMTSAGSVAAVGATVLELLKSHCSDSTKAKTTADPSAPYESALGMFVLLPWGFASLLTVGAFSVHIAIILHNLMSSNWKKTVWAFGVALAVLLSTALTGALLVYLSTRPMLRLSWYLRPSFVLTATTTLLGPVTLVVGLVRPRHVTRGHLRLMTSVAGLGFSLVAALCARLHMATALLFLLPALALAVPAVTGYGNVLATLVSFVLVHNVLFDLVIESFGCIGLYEVKADLIVSALIPLLTALPILSLVPALLFLKPKPALALAALLCLLGCFTFTPFKYSDARPATVLMGHYREDDVDTVQLCSMRLTDVDEIYVPLFQSLGIAFTKSDVCDLLIESKRPLHTAALDVVPTAPSTFIPPELKVATDLVSGHKIVTIVVDTTASNSVNARWGLILTPTESAVLRTSLDESYVGTLPADEAKTLMHVGAAGSIVTFEVELDSIYGEVTVSLYSRSPVIPPAMDELLARLPGWVRPFGKSVQYGPDLFVERVHA
ncbi:Peptidase family M28 [Carpediemonas membranifera]|uniref:Peptidase family M28 n=1 Tax=Carpediemonas membranifera TaxID=201153 RepID=A0A8J6B5F3_9EUKA|nr:Peptidase family M28 [Carpediemonas membranifera]|eukprot:KAG9396048.1 Peptidase family M28 [Carpediemonas membranifera]